MKQDVQPGTVMTEDGVQAADRAMDAGPTSPRPERALTKRPLALIVFLENTGRISGVNLPAPVTALVDFLTEEYAKLALHVHGAWGRYDRVVVLEDERATGIELRAALVGASRSHRVDLLILAHGLPGVIVGYKGRRIGSEFFAPLLDDYHRDPTLLDLRMVWQMNCYGASLVATWRALGARSVNGSVGVNWLPEPTMSVFVRRWLRGDSYPMAVERSVRLAERAWSPILRKQRDQTAHPHLESSRPIVYGEDLDFKA